MVARGSAGFGGRGMARGVHDWARALRLQIRVSVLPHVVFFFSSRRRHTRLQGDWSSDVCSSDLTLGDGRQYFIQTATDASAGQILVVKGEARAFELAPQSFALGAVGRFVIDEIGRASCRERV